MWSSTQIRQITLSRVVWNILRHSLMLPTILLLMTYKVLCQRPFGVFLKIHPNLRLRSSLISPTHFLHLFIFSNLFRTSTYLCPGWLFNWRGCHFFETCWGSFSKVQSLNCQNILLKTISSCDDVWNLLRFVYIFKILYCKLFLHMIWWCYRLAFLGQQWRCWHYPWSLSRWSSLSFSAGWSWGQSWWWDNHANNWGNNI